MAYLNKPLLSVTFSLLALFAAIAMMAGMRVLPEQQSMQTFIILGPATVVLAILGYLLGAVKAQHDNARLATAGYLLGGGILLTIVLGLLSWMA